MTDLFGDSRVENINVVDILNSTAVARTIQSIDAEDGDKDILVSLSGDLEWPFPPDEASGKVTGRHAVVLIDKDTGSIKYVNMSREQL